MTARAVATRRIRMPAMVDCEGCALDSNANAAQVRRHVAETGHTVRMIVEETTVYELDGETR